MNIPRSLPRGSGSLVQVGPLVELGGPGQRLGGGNKSQGPEQLRKALWSQLTRAWQMAGLQAVGGRRPLRWSTVCQNKGFPGIRLPITKTHSRVPRIELGQCAEVLQ